MKKDIIHLGVALGIASLLPAGLISCKNENRQIAKGSKPENLKGFTTNIEKSTVDNTDFRRVLYTANHMQLVLMSLKPKEEIGAETHPDVDQFFRIEAGKGICVINNDTYNISDGDVVIVPAGAKHNIINTDSASDLKLYTIYSPPEHKDAVVRTTKKEAEENKEEFDGKTTE